MSVLVVEDNDDVRELVAMVLTDAGFEVLEASDGARALDVLRNAPVPPCVVLLDVMMPRMDGYGVVAALREEPRLAHVPVVFVTADQHAREVDGVLEVVRKPVAPAALVDLASRFCRC
ncbi:response regulator [Sandaracinus amylolyticus]|uniref:Response regulator receiver n=1 Tax=Sandaracinus amylolyticus TaxID=927083 RepID=A0A0F6W0S4_9BACT|nr:response regulator [Sandaracinus amylolyticus]AKF04511.1 response regulator receiver [Sandaracinus amylolyticus]